MVGIRGSEPPIVVIGELKLSFNLDLVLQAVDRTAASDEVWLAVGSAGRKRLGDPRVHKLCRFLSFGLLPYRPRARLKCWSSRGSGGLGRIGSGALCSSMNTESGLETLLRADQPDSRS
jgi:hypothetical protein